MKLITTLLFTLLFAVPSFAKNTISDANDPTNGILREYYANGRVEQVREFKNNELSGIYLAFHQNGMLSDEATFENGKQTGRAKRYDEKGNLILLAEYKNGELVGETLYDEHGNILKDTSEKSSVK